MLKKVVATILMLSMILSYNIFSASAFEEQMADIIVCEKFDNYPTNFLPDGYEILGRSSGVIEYAKKNKGLAFKHLKGENGIVVGGLSGKLENKFYVAVDILNGNCIDGEISLGTGSGDVPVLQFKDNYVLTYNGKHIGGLSKNIIKSFVMQIDLVTREYDICINGKNVVSNFYHTELNESLSVSDLKILISSKEKGEVVFDNIFVGNGVFKGVNIGITEYNPTILEEISIEKIVTEDIYRVIDFESSVPGNLYGKDNILQVVEHNENNKILQFKRTGTQDMHWDLSGGFGYDSDVLVYQFDIFLVSDKAKFNFVFLDNDRNEWKPFSLSSGGVLTSGDSSYKLKSDKWYTISLLYDGYEKIASLYVDGVKVSKNFAHDFNYKEGLIVRWHTAGEALKEEFYIDNYVIYGGEKILPKILTEGIDYTIDVSGERSIFESDNLYKGFMQGKVGYHERTGIIYKNGEKIRTTILPYRDNEVLMVPTSFFEIAFDTEVLKGTIMKNGVEFAPLISTCENLLGKNVLYDNSATSGGMYLISDDKTEIPESVDVQKLNNFLLYERPTLEKIKEDYENSSVKGQHPRIYATYDDFEKIKQNIKIDNRMANWAKGLLASADNLVANPKPIEYYLPDGIRLMYAAQEFQNKIWTLAMAYRLTLDEKYAQRAWIDMKAVAEFKDWNPSHAMDVGIMSAAFALGYDWLYDYYTPEQRDILVKGVYRNSFYDNNRSYMSAGGRMGSHALAENNHGPIHNGGALLCGLAFFDELPDESAYMVANGIRGTEYSIANYAPDGAWFEGPGYAALTLEYIVYTIAGLDSVLSYTYGLDKSEGLNKAAEFILYIQSPMGSFDLTEGGVTTEVAYTSTFLFMADYFGRNDLVSSLYSSFKGTVRETAYHSLLWYKPEKIGDANSLPLDMYAEGDNFVTMRDTWEGTSTFVGFKGSNDSISHRHLNMGTFAFYANGVKWATDIGYDDYNLPSRLDLFRQRAEAHNCLVVDPPSTGGDYDLFAVADITRFESKDKGVIAVADMTSSHAGRVINAKRGVFFTDNRKSLVVRDEVLLDNVKDHDVYWFMQTMQDAVVEGNSVILSDKTSPNKLKIDFICSNENIEISCAQAAPLPTSPNPEGNIEHKGKTRIMLKTKGKGSISITAKLTPMNIFGSDVSEYNISMDDWVVPDGTRPEEAYLDTLVIGGREYPVYQQSITHMLNSGETEVPQITALSERCNVTIENAKTINDETVITVTDKVDSTNKSQYKIRYSVYKNTGIENFVEYSIGSVVASSVPQYENGELNVLDRNLDTRWSADGVGENLTLDLIDVKDINAVVMSFYLGAQRTTFFEISVSEDNSSYISVYKGQSSGKTEGFEIFDIGNRKARYIKITYSGNSEGTWNSITEVAAGKKY